MGFSDDAARLLADHSTQFGQAIDYRSTPGGSFAALPGCVVHGEQIVNRKTPSGWAKIAVRDVLVPQSSLASPSLFAEIRIGSVVYTVDEIAVRGAKRWRLQLRRAQATEVSRPGHIND